MATDNKIIQQFDFHFVNGDSNGEIKDVVLTAKTQEACREVINEAKKLPPKIRNESELHRYIECLGQVRETQKRLRDAKNRRKEPYVQLNQKIESATWQFEMDLGTFTNSLKIEIARFEEERRVGAERLKEELLKKANEEELAARYSDNPVKKRHAKNRAIQYKEEAKKNEPQATPGIATHWGWRFKDLANKQTAIRTHPEFFELDEDAVNKAIKELEKHGERINESLFPGIELERYSCVTYRR